MSPAMFQILLIRHPHGADGLLALPKLVILRARLSSAFPNSSRKSLHACSVSRVLRGEWHETDTCRCTEPRITVAESIRQRGRTQFAGSSCYRLPVDLAFAIQSRNRTCRARLDRPIAR